MIRYVKYGSLLCNDMQNIVLPVNCMGYMTTGLQKIVQIQYPHIFGEFVSECMKGNVKPGKMMKYQMAGKNIYFLPLKLRPEDKDDIKYLVQALNWFKSNWQQEEILTLGIPKIDLNGIDWTDASALIRNYFNDLPIEIELYE